MVGLADTVDQTDYVDDPDGDQEEETYGEELEIWTADYFEGVGDGLLHRWSLVALHRVHERDVVDVGFV